jgi:hypothetical protein
MFEYMIKLVVLDGGYYNEQFKELNCLGRDGWEAFAVTTSGDDRIYHLKRHLMIQGERRGLV